MELQIYILFNISNNFIYFYILVNVKFGVRIINSLLFCCVFKKQLFIFATLI